MMATGESAEVRAPHGLGLVRRNCRFRTDPAFARFLAKEIPKLAGKDLGCETASYAMTLALRGNPDGLLAEFGVYRGASLRRLAALARPRRVYGFDSFEGFPEDWLPGMRKGFFSLKGKAPQAPPNVSLVKGWFEQSLPAFLAEHPGRPFSFMHVDSDLYSSCRTVLRLAAGRIAPGTIIAFDEIWNFKPFYLGEMRAFFEFITRTRTRFEWIGHGYDTGCATRLPGASGRALGHFVRSLAAMSSRPPKLKVAAAVRIL